MTIIKLLAVIAGIHVAFGITQIADFYFGGGQDRLADGSPAAGNLIAYTPLQYLLLENSEVGQGDSLPTDVTTREGDTGFFGIIDLLNRIGDSGFGMLTFDYAFMDHFTGDANTGITRNIDWIVKLTGVLLHFALGLGLVRLLFESGILSSTAGVAMVGFAGLATSITAIISRIV